MWSVQYSCRLICYLCPSCFKFLSVMGFLLYAFDYALISHRLLHMISPFGGKILPIFQNCAVALSIRSRIRSCLCPV